MTAYIHNQCSISFCNEVDLQALKHAVVESFGDTSVLIVDDAAAGDNMDHESLWITADGRRTGAPENGVIIKFNSRPTNPVARARTRTTQGPPYTVSEHQSLSIYEFRQPLRDGYYELTIDPSPTDRPQVPIQIAVYNPEKRELHIPLHFEVMCGYLEFGLDWNVYFNLFSRVLRDPNMLDMFNAEAEAHLFNSFYGFVESAHFAEAEDLEQTIESNITSIEEWRGYIRENERAIARCQRQLAAILDGTVTLNRGDADRQLAAINRHVQVDSYELARDGKKLIVYTNNIYLPDPTNQGREDAILGEYKITLDFAANTVNAANLTNRKRTYDHPHIHDESFCTGTWSATVQQLMEGREFAAAVNFVIDTLAHCNPDDDWGRSYRHWFTDDNNEIAMQNATRS